MGKFGGTNMPGWGWSESPLLDGGQVMFTPGGSVVALNKGDRRAGLADQDQGRRPLHVARGGRHRQRPAVHSLSTINP
jgi:hypothetical protein